MIIITSTGQAIKAKVASYTTTQPDMYSSYVDSNAGSTFGFTPAFTASTVDTFGAPIMDAPASGHERQLKCCSIHNVDTAPVVVTVYQTGSATYIIQKCTLQVGDTLHYEDSRGWYVVDSNGQVKTGGSNGNSHNYRKNSTGSVLTRPRLNVIEGSNITVTMSDDSTDNEVDLTIAAAGGGSGSVTSVATAGLATGGPITGTGTVTVSAATQAEQEAGSSTSVGVTPGRQQYHPSAVKGWAYVTYSGGVPTLQASYNVLSITDNGVGALTITWDVDFSSTNYAIASVPLHNNAIHGYGVWEEVTSGSTRAAGTTRLAIINHSYSAYIDPAAGGVSLIALGDQLGDQ